MNGRILLALPLASALTLFQPRHAAAQSTGFVHLKTHVASVTPYHELGVYRTYQQGANGLVETFSEEFTPGAHTFAEVDAIYANCRLSAHDITFTITAGQWTDVDVPMTFQDCFIGINSDYSNGIGDVNFTVFGNAGTLPVADCQTTYDAHNYVVYTNFHSCQGTVPYGATITATVTPGAAKSCCKNSATFAATESIGGVSDFSDRKYFFNDTSSSPPPQLLDQSTDLSIERIGGTEGGQVSTATYRVVNHGPNRANLVRVLAGPGSPATFTNAIGTRTVADGNCPVDGGCYTLLLPVGDSTTFFVRYSGIPGTADTTSRHAVRPFGAPSAFASDCITAEVTSYGNNDPNPSNNTVPCLGASVPVTVALGGATPANRTVQIGALNVPMLDFMLTPASQQTVNSVTVQAHGTGDDHVDVTAVNLYVDKNANGQVDPGDSLIASSAFVSNDGSVTMNVSPLYSVAAPTNFLVTYSFAVTFAQRLGGGLSLAMLPLLFLPAVWRRKRLVATVMIAMITTVAMAACGGGDSATGPPHPTGSSVTFQSTLTGVNVSGTDVAGVSLAGATITVDK